MAAYGCFEQFVNTNVATGGIGSGLEIIGGGQQFLYYHVVNGLQQVSYNPLQTFTQALSQGSFFYALFVWPLGQLAYSIYVGFSASEVGAFFTIFFIVIIIRSFTLLFTFKNYTQQIKMQAVQVKAAQIKSQYDQNDKEEKRKGQVETMALYKKYGVKPLSLIGSSFVTLPFFYAMYRVFSSLNVLKTENLGLVQLITSPISGLLSGQFQYLAIILVVIPIQFVSFKLPTWLAASRRTKALDAKAKKQYKSTQLVSNVIVVVFAIIAITVPTSLALYWMLSGVYTIIQSFAINEFLKRKSGKFNSGKKSRRKNYTYNLAS